MKILLPKTLAEPGTIGWPKSMDDRLWTIEALVLRYCVSIEDFFNAEMNSTLRVSPILASTAIKSIVKGQGMKAVRVAYAPIQSSHGYRFWVDYKLPGSTRWMQIKTSILEYR